MGFSARRSLTRLLVALAIAAGAGFMNGCGGASPNAPPAPAGTAAASQSIARTPQLLRVATAPQSPQPRWYVVAQAPVFPLQDKHVHGSRYDVHFLPGSLLRSITATVEEYNPGIVDFELGPHGTTFAVPVVVTVDYSGTNADPASPNYDGSLPVLLWLNPSTGLWEVVVGVNDPLTKHYVVVLTHFSRYCLAGRAGGTAEW